MLNKKVASFLLVFFSILSISDAIAGVKLSRNRIVYVQGARAESIAAINNSDQTYLVQSGASASQDGSGTAPFWVTPPIVRLNAQSQNLVQIVAKPEAASLPMDRESVFYFYTNMIPSTSKPEPDSSNSAVMKIGLKMVLKLFYRPKGLSLQSNKVASMLTFSREGNGVVVKNPTPYYASFSSLVFDGIAVDLNKQPSMIAPFGQLVYHESRMPHKVSWQLMDDYGSFTDEQQQTIR